MSVGGCAKHIKIKQYSLPEFKEKGVLGDNKNADFSQRTFQGLYSEKQTLTVELRSMQNEKNP